MDMEQELIDLLAQAAAFLPAWGWGVVGLAVGGCVLAKALMPAPTDASSSVYRAVYRVVTCVPALSVTLYERMKNRSTQKTVPYDGKRSLVRPAGEDRLWPLRLDSREGPQDA